MLSTLHLRCICTALFGAAVLFIGTAAPAAAQPDPETESDEAEADTRLAAPGPELDAEGVEDAGEVEDEDTEGEGTESLDAPEAEGEEENAEEAPEESEAPARPRGPALRFANSYFSWFNGVSAYTLAGPGGQLTYNPTYVMAWSLTPRFYLTDTTFLWLNQGVSVELTDSDDGTYNREPLLDDTLLDLRQNLSWEGFVFQVQGRLGFPLSKASQAAQRVMQTGLGVTVTRPFPEAANFTVSANFGYRRWWALSNVPVASPGERPVGADPVSGTPIEGYCRPSAGIDEPACTQASGVSSARDILVTGLTLSVSPVPELTISFQGLFVAMYGHELGEEQVPINGGTVTVGDNSRTHWRNFTYFALSAAYDVLPWLNLQLGVANSPVIAPLYNPNGSVRSPFNFDTQIFLSTTLTLDALYDELFTEQEETLTPEERQRRRQGLARSGGGVSF